MKKIFCSFLLFFGFVFLAFSQSDSSTMESKSTVDWTKNQFTSSVVYNIDKAGISLPAGRSTADHSLSINLPLLIKNPLLTLPVDSSTVLGDMVIRDNITLEQVIDIIDQGKKSPSYFTKGLEELQIIHSISLKDVAELLVMHNAPYSPQSPIEKVASRKYTGIVIDCRGQLKVHGEFSTDNAVPCLFPKIWDDSMELLYERNMVQSHIAKTKGIVTYASTDDESTYIDVIGTDPLRISARKIFGVHRTDPIISRKDALKILSIPENRKLLQEGKVVFLLDKDALIHGVSSPQKNQEYYLAYKAVEDFYYEKKIPDVVIADGPKGLLISIENLQFIADSAQLLDGETERLDTIALALKEATKDGGFTILVEGHTASVGKPTGEMNLSIERSRTIINEMTKRGVPETLFSYRGYGGTSPLADNDSPEGRARNRRVEINVVPQQTYVQRIP